jgi:hypothetical protein
MTQSNTEAAGMPVRIIKVGTCPNSSGKAKLTYHLGSLNGAALLLRIWANSRAGAFSKAWTGLAALEKALSSAGDKPFTPAVLLGTAIKGKGVNTPAFVMAVLKHEGLVKPAEDKKRHFVRCDPGPFYAAVKALLKAPAQAEGKAPVEAKKPMPAKKAPAKAAAAPKKRPSPSKK